MQESDDEQQSIEKIFWQVPCTEEGSADSTMIKAKVFYIGFMSSGRHFS
jgi:hypothetical protein